MTHARVRQRPDQAALELWSICIYTIEREKFPDSQFTTNVTVHMTRFDPGNFEQKQDGPTGFICINFTYGQLNNILLYTVRAAWLALNMNRTLLLHPDLVEQYDKVLWQGLYPESSYTVARPIYGPDDVAVDCPSAPFVSHKFMKEVRDFMYSGKTPDPEAWKRINYKYDTRWLVLEGRLLSFCRPRDLISTPFSGICIQIWTWNQGWKQECKSF